MSYEHTLSGLPKLKPDIKKRWVKALRSGKYEQGTGTLRRRSQRVDSEGGRMKYVFEETNEFCCLGVLCDVVKDDKALEVNVTWDANNAGEFPLKAGRDINLYDYAMTPAAIDGYVLEDGDVSRGFEALAERNDGANQQRRQSFATIANIIERHC